jgi:TolB-like protein
MPRKLFTIAIAVILILVSKTNILRADPAPPKIQVAVAPFQVLAPAGSEWLGRAMQEGLATGIQKSSALSGIIIAGFPPADSTAAISLAKSSGANYVIFGSIQLQNDQMRVTGQILSTTTGQPIASLKSDGSQRDLFNIEDLLADRCQRLLLPVQPKSKSASNVPAPTLDLVGPTIASGASRYFDGNLLSQISPPADRYRDQYNSYYYQSADTSCIGYYYGCFSCAFPWFGACGGCGPCFGGHLVYPVAAPISGW